VSKAALLNALDGITTPDGRIFIMTTNYPERLDAALMRPGRADVHETFGYFEAAEQIQMAQRFFDDFIPLPFAVSPAEMQAAFMQFHNDSEAARVH
jgi:chaperone BCS1